MEIRVLGGIEVLEDERRVVLAAMPRRLLAVLLTRAGETVPRDVLIEALWGGRGPPSAAKLLQVYVSQLRKALPAPARIQTRAAGYALELTDGSLDAERFELMLDEARAAMSDGNRALAASLLDQALAIWQGPAYGEFAYDEFARGEAERLEELRLAATEAHIQARLALGQHSELLPQLRGLAASHPVREALIGQLMLALYRAGRQTDALAVYRRTAELLREELGLKPSRALQQLERSILRHDSSLSPGPSTVLGHRSGLPEQATSFLGRDQELAEISSLLQRDGVRLLTLTGAGGSGKTRLALRAADVCAKNYDDGARFVGFADITDPELLLPTICQGLGLMEQPDRAPAALLKGWLAERELLLVLDNLEQLTLGTAPLAGLLGDCPGLALLVTSREPLHVSGEQQYHVPALAPSEAIELFTGRARAVTPGLRVDPDVIESICERVDYLPLAIELAAARTKALSQAEIGRRLDKRLPLLAGGPRDVPRRHQTMRATIDWSYDLLDGQEKGLFARLAVFAGGCTLEAAEAICGAELDGLQGLVDKSLITGDGDRYRMLQTVREYALEQLGATTEAQPVADRHLDWYCKLGERGEAGLRGPDRAAWLELLELEHPNLETALVHAMDGSAKLGSLRLCAALGRFWNATVRLAEGRHWCETALKYDTISPSSDRASVLRFLADLAIRQTRYADGESAVEQALELFREQGDPRGTGLCLTTAGVLAHIQGDYQRAWLCFTQARAAFAQIADEQGEGISVGNLGEVAAAQGNYQRAADLLKQSIELLTGKVGPEVLSNQMCQLAKVAAASGDLERARVMCRDGIAAAATGPDPIRQSQAIEATGVLAVAEHRYDLAVLLLAAAETARASIGAGVHWDPGDAQRALASAQAAIADPAEFTRCWEKGTRMNLAQATATARQYCSTDDLAVRSGPEPLCCPGSRLR